MVLKSVFMEVTGCTMASRFGWVDFDRGQHRQMLDVIQLFRKRDTRDELGIGLVRDAFANYFFPGTSTIQTRARYFFFVPWIYMYAQKKSHNKGWSPRRVRDYVEYYEKRLIGALEAGGESGSVIGIEARERLQRLPSSIYWSGLGSLGLRSLSASQGDLCRIASRISGGESLASLQATVLFAKEHDEGEQKSQFLAWHPKVPAAPEKFLNSTNFKLTWKEADFLRERIQQHHTDSLFAFLLGGRRIRKRTVFLWDHPLVRDVSADLRESVQHARNLSELFRGVMLTYNLLLARKLQHDDRVAEYEGELSQWEEDVGERWSDISRWGVSPSHFWSCKAIAGNPGARKARSFIDALMGHASEAQRPGNLCDRPAFHQLIISRELYQKGPKRARLHNTEALARWRGQSGTGQMGYRWTVAQRMVEDIQAGLRRKDGDRA